MEETNQSTPIKKGPTNKEETKERILLTLKEFKILSRSALALKSRTAFYTLPKICDELIADNKIEILVSPKAIYYKLKEEETNGKEETLLA